MPVNRGDMHQIEEDEEDERKKSGEYLGAKRRFNEFECPTCSANNPLEFGHGDEVPCSYCGLSFLVNVDDDGKLKLREL
jgi:uncharacterized Zn-finger protein